MHRDYSIKGTSLMIEIFDDRVEITNPGGLAPGLSGDSFGRVSIRRNELIADLFYRLDKVERVGMGIQQMKEAMLRAGLKEPAFRTDGFFMATFFRPRKEDIFPAQKEDTLTVEKLLDAIKSNPKITQKELAKATGLTRRGIEWNLKELKKKGLLRRISPDKGGHWEILTHAD